MSFAVPRGCIYGLLGPNGAGKSTVVKILSTIAAPSSGRAAVFGFDVVRQPLAVRRQMTVVLQQTAAETLLTVRDNLLIYAYLHGVDRRTAQQRAQRVAEEFEIDANTSWGFFMDKGFRDFLRAADLPDRAPADPDRQNLLQRLVELDRIAAGDRAGVAAMDVAVRWSMLPLTLAVVIAATAGWFFVFSAFAIKLRRMDSFHTVTSASYILPMFFSPMFYPLTDLPGWFRAIAYLNAMTWQVDLLRYSLLGTGDQMTLWIEAAAAIAFAAIGLAVAVRTLNRAA